MRTSPSPSHSPRSSAHHSQLSLHDITKRYDDRVVFDRISFAVKPGEKGGVIGDNGSGKSTLLKLVTGREAANDGELTVRAPGGVGYLAQTLELPPDATVQDAVDLALADLRDLEAWMRRAEAALADGADPGRGTVPGGTGPEFDVAFERYAELVAQYEARSGYGADARVEAAPHGLGLPVWSAADGWAPCPGASGRAWRRRSPWRRSRSCCSWTSRPTTWTTGP